MTALILNFKVIKDKGIRSLNECSHKMKHKGGCGFRLFHNFTPDPTLEVKFRSWNPTKRVLSLIWWPIKYHKASENG